MTETAPPPGETSPGKLAATLDHLALIRGKWEKLQAAQIAAEEQLLHRVGRMYEAREIGELQLIALYEAFSAVALPGYTKRWNAAVPLSAKRIPNLRTHLQYLLQNAPNMPDGTWRGTRPIGSGPIPVDGIPVVYVLYDAENGPCYVGSSEKFRARLQSHERDDKPFVRWSASRCSDREAAYQIEDRLLAEFKPYLNKRRGRLWAPGSSPSP